MTISFIFQIILILVAVVVVVRRNDRHIVFVLFVSLTADSFGVRALGPNILLYQFISLLLLPRTLPFLPRLLKRNASIRLIVLYLGLLVILAILFGYVVPWPDTTLQRPWQEQAQGRAVVSLTRHLADFGFLLYLNLAARRTRILKTIVAALLFGLVANLVVATVDRTLGIRIIDVLTSSKALILTRVGGLNGEPRVLGRVSAIVMLFVFYLGKRRLTLLAGLALGLAGLAYSASTSALGALAAALIFGLVAALVRRDLRSLSRYALIPVLAVVGFVMVWGGQVNKTVDTRLNTLSGMNDRAPGEPAWMARLEVFDRSAMRFLYANPEYLIFGTGPDLVSLPASDYVPRLARAIYGYRIDSVPHTGVISILANGGIIGVTLWLLAILAGAKTLAACAKKADGEDAVALGPLFSVVAVFCAIVMTPFLWGVIGLSAGIVERQRDALRARRALLSNAERTPPLAQAI